MSSSLTASTRECSCSAYRTHPLWPCLLTAQPCGFSITRHPSYFGFFYWAMGTQIALANPVSTLVFAIVLWRFFNRRIKGASLPCLPRARLPRLTAHSRSRAQAKRHTWCLSLASSMLPIASRPAR